MTPYEAGLGRVVRLDKPGDFVGRAALAARAADGPPKVLVGLVVNSRRVPRHGYPVLAGRLRRVGAVGVVTSGGPSPSLGPPIATAYVAEDAGSGPFFIDVRDGRSRLMTELPFYDRRKRR